jgi:tetratricopeptide (TPR) repeat protein
MANAAPPTQADVDTIVGLMCQSIEHSQSQRWTDALACLDAGLRMQPGFFPCRLARARLLAGLLRFDEALADLNAVLKQAHLPDVLAGYATMLEAALAHLDARLAADPADPAAWFQRGRVQAQARNPLAAVADYDRALALDARATAIHMARGNALMDLGRYAAAVAAYECVLEFDRGNALAWYNRGNALQKQGRLRDAIASYHLANAITPDFAEASLEEAHCRLALGEYAQGWRLYEWRWRTAQLRHAQLASAQPRWLGEASLAGQTILLWAEQGYGDTIQFARFIPRVADLAAGVVVRVPQALRELLSTLDRRVTVIGDGEPLPPHDVQTPLMSLPLALGVTNDLAAVDGVYLRCEAGRRQDWHARLGASGRPRLGLCWAGRREGAAGACNPGRDLTLAALAPLASANADIVCLQKEYSEDEQRGLAMLPAFQAVALGDFADTAALIGSLDLVITVDTAIAHLAGALGKPCWLLLRRSSEWRWQLERADSAWYSSITIFRQQEEGGWDEVVQRVLTALRHLG